MRYKTVQPRATLGPGSTSRATGVEEAMRITVGSQVFSESVDDETVLIELGSGKYYGLDRTGSRLWQLLSELRSTDAVIDTALQEYDVERQVLARDVHELVRNLAARRLVTIDG